MARPATRIKLTEYEEKLMGKMDLSPAVEKEARRVWKQNGAEEPAPLFFVLLKHLWPMIMVATVGTALAYKNSIVWDVIRWTGYLIVALHMVWFVIYSRGRCRMILRDYGNYEETLNSYALDLWRGQGFFAGLYRAMAYLVTAFLLFVIGHPYFAFGFLLTWGMYRFHIWRAITVINDDMAYIDQEAMASGGETDHSQMGTPDLAS